MCVSLELKGMGKLQVSYIVHMWVPRMETRMLGTETELGEKNKDSEIAVAFSEVTEDSLRRC